MKTLLLPNRKEAKKMTYAELEKLCYKMSDWQSNIIDIIVEKEEAEKNKKRK